MNVLGAPPPNVSLRAFVESITHPMVRAQRAAATAEVLQARRNNRASLEAAARIRAGRYAWRRR